MSNETEKVCLNGMIEYVEGKIQHNEQRIADLRSQYPLFRKEDPYYNRPTEINKKIQEFEGELTRFRNVLWVLRFNEENGITHVHVDKTWIPETEKVEVKNNLTGTFADLEND